MSGDIKGLLAVGLDILATAVSKTTGKITAQLGSVTGETADTDSAEWWQHIGFVSRPSKPDAGKSSAQGVAVRTGSHDVIVASQDLRGLDLYENLGDGEAAVYASGKDGTGQARVMVRGDGSIYLMTTDTNLKDGTAVTLVLSPKKLAFDAPWGSLLWDNSGFHLKDQAGVRIDMGGMAVPGLPPSLTGIMTSYVKIAAAKFTAKCSMVLLGPGPTYETVVHAKADLITKPPSPLMSGAMTQSGAVRVSTP